MNKARLRGLRFLPWASAGARLLPKRATGGAISQKRVPMESRNESTGVKLVLGSQATCAKNRGQS